MQGVAALLMDQHLVICRQKSLQKHLIFWIAVSFTSIKQLFESFQAAKDLENSKWCNRKGRGPWEAHFISKLFCTDTKCQLGFAWLSIVACAWGCGLPSVPSMGSWIAKLQLHWPVRASHFEPPMSQTNGSTLARLVVFKRMLNVNYSNCS